MVMAIIGFLAILFFVGCALCIGAIILCDVFDWGEFDSEDEESEATDSDSVPNRFKAPKEDAIPISPVISAEYTDGQKISDEEYDRLLESFRKSLDAPLYNHPDSKSFQKSV